MLKTPVSVCCLAFNCERTVRMTVDSIRQMADEIVIVDSYSTDSTTDIVKEFTDKIYFRPYQYHGTQMNYALEHCSFDWAFCIDSDVAIDNVMAQNILRIKQSGMEGQEAYRVTRKWFFLGREVHAFFPVSYPDRIMRFKVRLLHLFLNPLGAFIKWYVFKKNFLDGGQGLVLGRYAAPYTFLKYVKLYHARMTCSLA